MAKKKHIWHCGLCHGDLLVTRKGKGKSYLFCPTCDKMVAYHNKGVLGKIARGAVRSLPGGDIVAEFLPSAKTPAPVTVKETKTFKLSPEERVAQIEKLLRGR